MDSGDLESRVSALEEQVQDLTGRVRATEQDAAAARVLAGAADRDVSKFRGEMRNFRRATTASFNALGRDFADRRTHVDDGFVEMRGRFDVMAVGQQQIVDLLQSIITDEGRGGSAR